MGLLDDLEQEAQRRKANQDGSQQDQERREKAYKTQVEPAMAALHDYLGKLTKNLNYLKPKHQVRYELGGYGTLVGYIDHEYEIQQATPDKSSKEVRLSFPCLLAAEECPVVEVQSAAKVKNLAALFQRLRLGSMQDAKKDPSGDVVSATFRAKGKIMLTLSAVASVDADSVRLTFTNFRELGNLTKAVPYAQFNDALFDELGRFIAQEETALFKEALPDAYRKQLQSKVQQDVMKRKWEEKIAAQQQSELEKLRKQQSLTSKFGKLVDKVKEKAADQPWLSNALGKFMKKKGEPDAK